MSSGVIRKIVSVKLLVQEMEEVSAEGTERAVTPVNDYTKSGYPPCRVIKKRYMVDIQDRD